MDLKQIYREETELEVYTVALMEQRVEHFSNEYVKWLEAKINNTRICEQLHLCKYVKREGESCTLNNNCKYPNCE